MSVIRYNNEKLTEKRVRFTAAATEILKAGYPFCYNWDKGTATAEDGERAMFVEKPAAANLVHFAGWLKEEHAGKKVISGETYMLTLVVPQSRGQKIPVFTDLSTTQGTTELHITSGSWLHSDAGKVVGLAVQTVDRSTTNGTVQALVYGPVGNALPTQSARSRAVTALPTAAIWDNFDLDSMRKDPFAGSLLEADFTHANERPDNMFIDATYAASAAGKTPTELVFGGTEAVGELTLFTTTDNQAAEGQWSVPITVSGGNKWGFEARIKQSTITDTKINWFCGLMLAYGLTGDLIADGAALADVGSIGYQMKEGDGNSIDFVYDEDGQAQNEHDTDIYVPAVDTYNTIGMYFNGTTIQMYVDGVASGTAVSAVDIAAVDFPTAAVLVPTIAMKGGHADDGDISLDWIRVAQPA